MVEHLADTAAVLVVDETGSLRRGTSRLGCSASIAAR